DIVTARSQEIGLDPAYVYGLIRQESRFISDARSSVGASGLMQLMPNTARWVARKLALEYKPEQIVDPTFNETRDYVKKVLSNAAVYASLINGRTLSLKSWLGAQAIGPRDVAAPAV